MSVVKNTLLDYASVTVPTRITAPHKSWQSAEVINAVQ